MDTPSDAPDYAFILASLAFSALFVAYRRQKIKRRTNSTCAPTVHTVKKVAPVKEAINDPMIRGTVIPGAKIDEIRLHSLQNLSEFFPSENYPNTDSGAADEAHPSKDKVVYNKVIHNDYIIADIVRNGRNTSTEAFVRAGPRAVLHFNPKRVRAAIVTCGGLCPGLNNVIREIVHALTYLYDADTIIGVRGGFNGMTNGISPIILTPAVVADCHHDGGSILGSARGGFDANRIIEWLTEHNINQIYIIGGDGTHRGANALSEEVIARKLNIAVIGIPKTIDNDVDLIDRSFGFQSAIEVAQLAIKSAVCEAKCNVPNGVGIVKLMGRSAGFIAAHAALGSGDVDCCLVPEVPIAMSGEYSILQFIYDRVMEKGYAVVVVAEGAGEDILGKCAEVDAGGNRKLPAIGEFMREKVTQFFKDKGLPSNVKYINPSYMIRSGPANSSDSLYCMLLAQNAVHGAMAGYTAFTTGLVNNRVVFIPIPRIVATSPRIMDPKGRTWERVLAATRQPNCPVVLDGNVNVNSRTIF